VTAAGLQEEEWKLSALQPLGSLSLCPLIQPEGEIMNLLHPSEWVAFTNNTGGKWSRKSLGGTHAFLMSSGVAFFWTPNVW